MKIILVAVHGILTRTTDASWPDRFEAWLLQHDPEIHVEKRKYAAGPLPRWNVWVKDPLLARGLASELRVISEANPGVPIWFVAHSNGAVIALLTAKLLIDAGVGAAGVILTGAAVEADISKNGILHWWACGDLDAAIAYSSADDAIVAGDPSAPTAWYWKLRDWAWGKAMWPYGCLGRTGWTFGGIPKLNTEKPPQIYTRWFAGGHSCYFAAGQEEKTFEQMYEDIAAVERVGMAVGKWKS